MAAIHMLSLYMLPSQMGQNRLLAERMGEIMFERIQYDTLRHIRAYWLPCWLLHWETKVAQCQFLPTSIGGSALFYIASHPSALTDPRWMPEIENQSESFSTNTYFQWSPEQEESEDYETGIDYFQHDRNTPEGEDEEEVQAASFSERKWIEEIRDRALSRALRTDRGKLIEIEGNRTLIKSAQAKRLKQPPPSTLASNYSELTRYSNIIQVPKGTSRSTRSSFLLPGEDDGTWLMSIPVAWSVPCEPGVILGLTKLPGFPWESLRNGSTQRTTSPRLSVSHTYELGTSKDSAVFIEPFTEALGLEKQESILTMPNAKNADSSYPLFIKTVHSSQSFVTLKKSQLKSNKTIGARMRTALIADAASGGPFQAYLES